MARIFTAKRATLRRPNATLRFWSGINNSNAVAGKLQSQSGNQIDNPRPDQQSLCWRMSVTADRDARTSDSDFYLMEVIVAKKRTGKRLL